MSFLNDLNPVQQEAVKAIDGPVMIVAGAGSGKTRVLTYRIAYLSQCGVSPAQILALTFTNKAAEEMKTRVASLLGKRCDSLWIGTFHSMFARILRLECEKIGYQKNFTIYDASDSLSLIKNVMVDLGLSQQQFNPQAIRSLISVAKNQLVSEKEFASRVSNLFEEKVALVYARYQEQLKRYNGMDFDDLLLKPIQLFQSHKKVLKRYQERFRFVLIDEYQDTNRAQYIMMKLLVATHQNICVVGDDAQSIYAFRGAEIRNILDFERDYPGAKIFRLEQNYRSTKKILNVAGRLIRHNVNQIVKSLWTENHSGEPVRIMVCNDDQDEGMRIVSAILEDCRRCKFDLKDFAVLYRTNAQSRVIEDALRHHNVPYTIVGGVEFYQRKEIKDVLAYFRVLVNPSDQESLLRAISNPNRGIGKTTIKHLIRYAEKMQITLYKAIIQVDSIPGITERARKNLLNFSKMIEKYRTLQTQIPVSELCRALVDELGILRIFKEEGTPEAIARLENVQELLTAISEYWSEHDDATLEGFLQEVSLVSDVDSWDGKQNVVTLMTLHSAKGLEFPVVFIAGMEEGLLPYYNTDIDHKELEEERRLCYVGITRAKKKLYLTGTRLRYRFGQVTYPVFSRFLDEIGREGVEVIEFQRQAVSERKPREKRDRSASYLENFIPHYAEEEKSSQEFKVGCLVEHETFGRGKVISIYGQGSDTRAVVDFSDIGSKQLLLRYAKLKLI